jgi:hypothetical protein
MLNACSSQPRIICKDVTFLPCYHLLFQTNGIKREGSDSDDSDDSNILGMKKRKQHVKKKISSSDSVSSSDEKVRQIW